MRKPRRSEIAAELEFHLQQLIREKVAQGLSPAEARRQARLEFGGAVSIEEELGDVHRIPFFDALSLHVRYALRALRAAPSFSLTVIATLTLGIGANTAVFSAIDAVLLRPLPFPDADRLLVLNEYRPRQSSLTQIAPPRLEDWNRLNSTFQTISGWFTEDTTAGGAGQRFKTKRAFVAPRFLATLGVSPALGHDFTSADEHFHGYTDGNVLVSNRFWREHLNANPNAIGRPLRDKDSAVVIGVMPANFGFPEADVDLWYVSPPDAPYAQDRRNTWYTGIGRLKPGVSDTQARANLGVVQRQLARQFPATDNELTGREQPLKETTVGSARASLWLLFSAVSVLLLIACTNVSALVLARGMERTREFSVRLSLGASRAAIVAQVMTETALLAITGTATGLVFAAASARTLAAMAKSIPRITEVGLDWRLFLYTAICAAFVTLLSGLFPALRASSATPAGALSRGGRTQVSTERHTQSILVSIQVALAVCLLSGAGLLLRSFEALSNVSPGFDSSHVLVFRLTGGYGETKDIPQMTQSIYRTIDSLRSLPGVQSAATSMNLPGIPFRYPLPVKSTDSAVDPAQVMMADARSVSDGYFSTVQIPMLAGKPCDRLTGSSGAVVNHTFAEKYFTGIDPVGHRLGVVSSDPLEPVPIVGMADDAREAGLNSAPTPVVYFCGPSIDPARYYLVRTSGDPMTLAGAVRRKMQETETTRAVYDMAPMAALVNDAYGEVRLRTLLLTLFAATALALACVGLYGAMAYFVTTRRREIGLRMALGAGRARVGLRFVTQGLAVTAAGALAGLCIARWAARFIASMLYNVHPGDAASFAIALVAMLAVALIASAIPALRAARIDPIQILREE